MNILAEGETSNVIVIGVMLVLQRAVSRRMGVQA